MRGAHIVRDGGAHVLQRGLGLVCAQLGLTYSRPS
eukprot:SAG11_NODE_17461_length_518_cov_0.739857_2_plen_34_part_01